MTPDDRRRRPFRLSTLVPLTLLAAFAADARAEPGDRRFAVLLAAPVRSLGNPIPPLPNPNDVYDQYFDTVKNNVDSFAEFWDEISYGNVSISGDVLGWVEVPWPVLPQHEELTIDPETATFGMVSGAVLPYVELNGGGLQPFTGEIFVESLQLTVVDQNGDLNEDGPQPPGLDDGSWTPGERYLDLNSNGKYDALLETSMDGDSPDGCGLKDGVIDAGEFCDVDGDATWDFPEPFEDFLVIYRPEGIWPDDHWIKLDPSPNNTFEGSPQLIESRQWAEAYIRTNYPGDADALIARCGNGQYDGPDFWFESSGAGNKLRRELFPVLGVSTPSPDSAARPWTFTYDQWWTAFWNEKHVAAGVDPVPPAPNSPEWVETIPNLAGFEPNNPSLGPLAFPCIAGRFADLRTFCPNAGGDLARNGVACDPDPFDDPLLDCFDDPENPNDFDGYVVDELFPGDGTYFTSYGGDKTDGVVMPDVLDKNQDGQFDWYDGPAEFDDLPSSIYHARDISGLTDGFGGLLDGVNGGDGRLGEVTSPFSSSEYGVDRGSEDPNGPPIGGDGIIPPAGPGAYFVHGSGPFDGGNVLNLEYLTWLNDPAGPAAVDPQDLPNYNLAAVFKRDFNLDGLLDQGEVRKPGTENYVVDADPFTPNNGGPATRYPFNRRRLTEDTIAALDPTVDWDYLVHQDLDIVKDYPVDVGNFLFSTVLLPEDVVGDGLAEAGRGLFQLPAPGMDLPIQVIESGNDQISPIWCSDFATGITGTTETGEPLMQNGFAKELLAHEFLHAWEGYPDLYDYDEYGGGIINKPMGRWDCMSGGGMVHPNPFLKEFGQGDYFVHEPWLDAIDLTHVLLPGREAQLVLPDYAFEPNGGAYYYGNPDRFLERFYFWRLTRVAPDDPELINFSRSLPGDGFMIMHTDIGKFEGFPEQQRKATHFTFNIVQADGLQQLENGENAGDGGDPFPGNANKLAWNHDTDPNARWWEQAYSGIEVRNVVHQPEFSLVTFLWQPRVVPELHFVRPPGGDVVNGDFVIHYEAFDRFGGTTIEFYADADASGYDGVALPPPASKPSGLVQGTHLAPLSVLNGDGIFRFYARLVPGPGEDDQIDPLFSQPRADATNKGRGHLSDADDEPGVSVDLANSKLEFWTVDCIDDWLAGAELWRVAGTISGEQGFAMTGALFTSTEGGVSFRIDSDAISESGPLANVSNADGVFLLTDPDAEFDPTTFDGGESVRITGGPAGVTPGFYTILEVPDPTTLKLAADAGDSGEAGGVTYRVHSFAAGSDGGPADRFSFLTTGKTAYSAPVRIVNGQVVPTVFPNIVVTYLDEMQNPEHEAPLLVRFDASSTLDEFGQPNPLLEYSWDFGDGAFGSDAVEDHLYIDPHPDGVVVSLTVTNPLSGLEGTATVQIVVKKPFVDTDLDTIHNDDDNCPFDPNPEQQDVDADGFGDACDNCPDAFDSSQTNSDGDEMGDACDPDDDNDGVADDTDNCRIVPNADQTDLDADGSGDACDADLDGDGIVNSQDNCEFLKNADQQDADLDGLGDACDNDADGDGVANGLDNCPDAANPAQHDADADAIGDACDPDLDGDGLSNDSDNCPLVSNARQEDEDADGIGDLCEGDIDADGVRDPFDNCPAAANAGQEDVDLDTVGDACDNCPDTANSDQADFDRNGHGDACDLIFYFEGCPNDVDLFARGPDGTPLYFATPRVVHPTGPFDLVASHESGRMFPIGESTVSFTASDPVYHVSITCAFVVRVRELPPVPSPAPNLTPAPSQSDQTAPPQTGCFPFGGFSVIATLAYAVHVGRRGRPKNKGVIGRLSHTALIAPTGPQS